MGDYRMTIGNYAFLGGVNPSGNKLITVKADRDDGFFDALTGKDESMHLKDDEYIIQMSKLNKVINKISEYDPKLGELLDQENVEINIKYASEDNNSIYKCQRYSTNQNKSNMSTIFYKDKEGKTRAEININYSDLEKLETNEDKVKFAGSLIRAINHAEDINNPNLSMEEMQMSNVEEEYQGIKEQTDFINWELANTKDVSASHILNPPPYASNPLASKEGVLWGYSKDNYSYDEKKNAFTINEAETKKTIKETYNSYLENQYGILLSYKNQIKKFESELSAIDPTRTEKIDLSKFKTAYEANKYINDNNAILNRDKKTSDNNFYENYGFRIDKIKTNIAELNAKTAEIESSIKTYDKDYTGQSVPHISD